MEIYLIMYEVFGDGSYIANVTPNAFDNQDKALIKAKEMEDNQEEPDLSKMFWVRTITVSLSN